MKDAARLAIFSGANGQREVPIEASPAVSEFTKAFTVAFKLKCGRVVSNADVRVLRAATNRRFDMRFEERFRLDGVVREEPIESLELPFGLRHVRKALRGSIRDGLTNHDSAAIEALVTKVNAPKLIRQRRKFHPPA